MNNYQYYPLDTSKSSFRLLRLRRGDAITIQCDIFHALISDPITLPYEALSYTWGSTELVELIEVNGHRLWITDSLYAALRSLRSHDQDRIIWADAICINQLDKVEQSQQVAIMDKIFGSAFRVIFWLGKPTWEVTLLMDSLHELQAGYVTLLKAGEQADGMTWKRLWSNRQLRLPSSSGDIQAQQRKGLQALLKRPWFERVWILQEVYNARSAVVCCGVLSVSANIFALSPSLLDQPLSQHVRSVLEMMPGSAELNSRPRRTQSDLIDLLSEFRACKATDQRDMIFALLGMSSEPSDQGPLRPDYTKPLLEVVGNTIDYWFRWTTTSIHQVIDVLSDFKTVRVTYLVLPPNLSTTGEMLKVPLLSGKNTIFA